jgi:ABC-type thiamin/hydroxymethylpyrimidine transport system permease subunit
LESELSDFEAENAMLKGDFWWEVVDIVIGGVPTILEVGFMCVFMSLGTILLQGSVLTNLFGPMRHQVDLRKVEVGIYLLGNIYLVADTIPPGLHVEPLLGRRTSFSICFLI